jgi:hypothetical protein
MFSVRINVCKVPEADVGEAGAARSAQAEQRNLTF